MKVKTFTVEGAGQFPFEHAALRSVLAGYAARRVANMCQHGERRRVTLKTFGYSTPERWASFMWRVVAETGIEPRIVLSMRRPKAR